MKVLNFFDVNCIIPISVTKYSTEKYMFHLLVMIQRTICGGKVFYAHCAMHIVPYLSFTICAIYSSNDFEFILFVNKSVDNTLFHVDSTCTEKNGGVMFLITLLIYCKIAVAFKLALKVLKSSDANRRFE